MSLICSYDRACIAIYSFYKSIFTIAIHFQPPKKHQKIIFGGFIEKVHIVDMLQSYWLAKSITRTPLP